MTFRLILPLSLAAGLLGPGAAMAAKPAPKARPAPPRPRPAAPAQLRPSAPPPAPAESRPAPAVEVRTVPKVNTWALLIGVSRYQCPAIASLRFPSGDATEIRDALVDPQLGGLPADHVRLLTDDQATAASIVGAVDDFLKPNVKPGDQVVLFLAGHGVAKGVGVEAKSFFLSTDVKGTTTAMLESSAVDLKALSAKLSELPASQFVVFVDACREDPTPGRGIKGNTMTDILGRGLQIVPQDTSRPAASASFFACSVGQRAFEDPSLKHGVFTYWILDGIRSANVPRNSDGAVDMGVLASYVKSRVSEWAKNTSAKGDFEVEQTPEFVTTEVSEPIVLVRVRRPCPASPLPAAPPTLTVATQPEGAQVSLDGRPLGASPVTTSLPKGGQYSLKVETPGCRPIERTVNALDGYGLLVTVRLPPGARDATASTDSVAADLFRRAQEAEARQQWEVAEAGYDAVIKADPKLATGYERLADLRLRRGKTPEAIGVLVEMVAQFPTARAYSLLSRAYSLFAARQESDEKEKAEPKRKKGGLLGSVLGKGGDKKDEDRNEAAAFGVPKDGREAAALAQRAADEAVRLDATSAEAQLALGFALLATDKDGKNKDAALAAFGKAVLLQPQDAANQYGLGYGIRTVAQGLKDAAARKAELQRAVAALQEALRLRPGYYEAHRELAFCRHLLDDLPGARREYEAANGCRGGATDEDEVVAVNLSLAGIHRQEAQNEDGEKKQNSLAASDGYVSDAKEINPNLSRALKILNRAGVSTRVADYLPSEVRRMMDLPGSIERDLKNRIRLPRFP